MRVLLIFFLAHLSWDGPSEHDVDSVVEVADVHVRVSTTFGDGLGSASVILREVGPGTEYRKAGDVRGDVDFSGVGFGLYDLEISARGFTTLHERVGIYQSDLRLDVGLFAAQIHESERPEIVGTVTAASGNAKNLRVRLVPLYSAGLLEDHVRSDGGFRIGGLHPGRFVILVLDKNELVLTRVLDYHGGRATVSLNVPSR